MSIDFSRLRDRKNLIREIEGNENRQRKLESLKQVEVWNDRLDQYVREELRGFVSELTEREMVKVSSINLTRRIINQEASLYRRPPKRRFINVSDEQSEVLDRIYTAMRANVMLMRSNASFKLQHQNHLMVVPQFGKLTLKVLRNHHIDSVPNDLNPEEAESYIIHSFDKRFSLEDEREITATGVSNTSELGGIKRDNLDQEIGDPEDFIPSTKRYIVWSPNMHFVMDESGRVLPDQNGETRTDNPIFPEIPIINIAGEQDFEYWVRQGQTITDFTIQYNAAMSDLGHIVRTQGFAQAIVKGPDNLMPENIQIGPNYVLRLPIDPDNPVETEFQYVSPNPDLQGSIQYIEMLLSNFLTSRGIDAGAITGRPQADRFNSGIERLLALIDRFEATRDDMNIYQRVEQQLFKKVVSWHNALRDTNQLDPEFKTQLISDDASIEVEFQKPEMIQTENEKVQNIREKMELGLISRVDAIAELNGVDRESALDIIKRIETDEGVNATAEGINANS